MNTPLMYTSSKEAFEPNAPHQNISHNGLNSEVSLEHLNDTLHIKWIPSPAMSGCLKQLDY